MNINIFFPCTSICMFYQGLKFYDNCFGEGIDSLFWPKMGDISMKSPKSLHLLVWNPFLLLYNLLILSASASSQTSRQLGLKLSIKHCSFTAFPVIVDQPFYRGKTCLVSLIIGSAQEILSGCFLLYSNWGGSE